MLSPISQSAYANQNEMDHAVLKRAIRGGKAEAVFEEGEVKRVRGDLKKNEDTDQSTWAHPS
jgi:hypothetical protein